VRLTIRRGEVGGWTVLALAGELDLATAPELRQAIVAAIADGAHHVALDTNDVEFIDSTGIGVVIGGLKRARSQAGTLRLVGPGPVVGQLLELTGLSDALGVVATIDRLPSVAGIGA
jgi:anti-sigma B factor antagonist